MIRRVRFRWVRAAAGVVVIDLATRLGLIAAAGAMAFGAGDAAFPLGHGYWIVAALSAVPRAGVVMHVGRGGEQE
ncbi:hypothetical protein E1264_08530 [Actinomadura sp. KC216]|uniref:hypothetical protein n=1 Tax=Actinomadura sp. KC216 TaxID=2530370 RepID=UPI001052F43C|nr:hypothetical protein [Actinomadura sp. KC216]TDB89381.1 hypothetical protein E1264_08530 [Actinomadura sp. KC216]